MESRSWGVRIGELSTLIYLIFPILAIFVDKRGNFLTYLIVCTIFIISYVTMILFYKHLSDSILYSLLVIHYLGIFYFVYSVNPMNSLFFFYSAFALPFIFNVRVVSKEFITFLIAMISCLILTYIFNPTFVVPLSAFYLVILIVAVGNFKNRDERIMKAKLEEKNKYINVLIAQQERNRISQDLHDTLGHVFASLTLKSELAVKLIDTNPKEAKNEMQAINQLSTEALNKVRLIIDDLKIQSFEDEISSLEHLLQNANLHFKFNNKSAAKSLNPAKQSILSMIFREAINNVIKHAHATEVIGELKVHEHQIILKIKDNGVGIENEDASNLKSIKERVDYLNGKLIVQSNNGTLTIVEIPRGDLL